MGEFMSKKVAILTDSNSGITQAAGKALGISVLPMPFYINDQLYYEDITLTQEQFYAHLDPHIDARGRRRAGPLGRAAEGA